MLKPDDARFLGNKVAWAFTAPPDWLRIPLDGNELDENGQTRGVLPGRCISSVYVLPTGRCISRYVYTDISWCFYILVCVYVGLPDKAILMYRSRWPSVDHLLAIRKRNALASLGRPHFVSFDS